MTDQLAPLPIVATRLEYQNWKDECPVRLARLAKGMTQGILATICGISAYTVSKYENGGVYPSGRTAAKLSLALGIPDINKQIRAWRKRCPK
jgi:predicted transcriptional regulator